jgi:hypothetical protein
VAITIVAELCNCINKIELIELNYYYVFCVIYYNVIIIINWIEMLFLILNGIIVINVTLTIIIIIIIITMYTL